MGQRKSLDHLGVWKRTRSPKRDHFRYELVRSVAAFDNSHERLAVQIMLGDDQVARGRADDAASTPFADCGDGPRNNTRNACGIEGVVRPSAGHLANLPDEDFPPG